MNVAILGFDVEGRASYDYFLKQGHTIAICDQNEQLSVPVEAQTQLGKQYLDNLDKFDLLVRTPGLQTAKILEKNPNVADKITSGTNEFFKATATKNIIGVTGTKGKGTTSTLLAKILKMSGRRVFLGGNIGVPALSFIDEVQEDDWVVLELSSFQLSDIAYAPHIAVCLMIVPEHLNWHTDFSDYAGAKARLFSNQKASDIAIYFADSEDSHEIASHSSGDKLSYFAPPGAYEENGVIKIDDQPICRTDELQILGAHNWQNVCAAITAAWQAGVMDIEAIHAAVTTFTGLPHRLEFVAEQGGIRYYDDSFGTTPETAIVAVQAFKEPKVVILGGSDKGTPFTELAAAVAANNVRAVVVIGNTGARIADELRATDFQGQIITGGTTMTEIVAAARQAAKDGDVILLSTGCASFGLFKDYKDRGNQFKKAVQALAEAAQ